MARVFAAAAWCCCLGIVATAALTIVAPTNLIGQSAVLVQADDLVHLGSFRLPRPAGAGFTYGGTALAYNAANNSLFVSTSDQRTAEVSIPAIGGTASLIQPITDSLDSKLTQVGSAPDGPRIGGHLVWGNTLITTGFLYYDAAHVQVNSHFTRPLKMSEGAVEGPVRAGREMAGYYSGYMAPVPAEWRTPLGGPALTGNCCLSIISRTSYGPALASFDPLKMGTAQMLLYYDAAHTTLGRYGEPKPNPIFNGTTKIRGLVFPEGTASVMFFGTTGTGKWCYGEASECGDPVFPYKGDHAYPYRPYVWAYDAREFIAVKSGKKRPWQVVPYASWEISALGPMSLDQIGGAAYDPRTSRLYLSTRNSDGGDNPLIHVFRISQRVAG